MKTTPEVHVQRLNNHETNKAKNSSELKAAPPQPNCRPPGEPTPRQTTASRACEKRLPFCSSLWCHCWFTRLWLLKSSLNPNVDNARHGLQVVQDRRGLDSANEHVPVVCFLQRHFSLESTQPRRMGRTHFLGSQVLHAPGQLVGA